MVSTRAASSRGIGGAAAAVALPAVLLLAAARLGGCDTADSMTGEVDADALPELTLVEEVRIGSLDDPDLGFSRISGVDVDEDGLTYVLESQEREIRVFDRDGRRVRTIGRQGSGPGEFGSPNRFGIIGDTVWVTDTRLSRLTLFTLEGDVLSTVESMGAVVDAPEGVTIRVRPNRMRRDRLFESGLSSMSYMVEPPGDIVVPRLLFDLKGNIVDTLSVDTIESAFSMLSDRITVGAITFIRPTPPTDAPRSLPTDDGTVRIERAHAPTRESSTFAVTRTDTAGDTLYHRTFRYAPKPYAGAATDSLVGQHARQYEERAGPDFEAVKAAIRDAYELPPYQSPVQSAQLGADGSVWLLREDTGGDYTWILLAPDGSPRGQLALPRRASIRWSSGDEAWIVVQDEYDVQWLVRYRLR